MLFYYLSPAVASQILTTSRDISQMANGGGTHYYSWPGPSIIWWPAQGIENAITVFFHKLASVDFQHEVK